MSTCAAYFQIVAQVLLCLILYYYSSLRTHDLVILNTNQVRNIIPASSLC